MCGRHVHVRGKVPTDCHTAGTDLRRQRRSDSVRANECRLDAHRKLTVSSNARDQRGEEEQEEEEGQGKQT